MMKNRSSALCGHVVDRNLRATSNSFVPTSLAWPQQITADFKGKLSQDDRFVINFCSS